MITPLEWSARSVSSERPPRPTRADYVHWETITTRWTDDDVYGHMNNAKYFELIDTAVNNHLAGATGTDIRTLPAIGVVAEVGCRYFRQIGYPQPVELGIVVDRLGTSSATYRVGLFQGDGDRSRRPRPRAGSCTSTSTTPTRPDPTAPWCRCRTRSGRRSPRSCARPDRSHAIGRPRAGRADRWDHAPLPGASPRHVTPSEDQPS